MSEFPSSESEHERDRRTMLELLPKIDGNSVQATPLVDPDAGREQVVAAIDQTTGSNTLNSDGTAPIAEWSKGKNLTRRRHAKLSGGRRPGRASGAKASEPRLNKEEFSAFARDVQTALDPEGLRQEGVGDPVAVIPSQEAELMASPSVSERQVSHESQSWTEERLLREVPDDAHVMLSGPDGEQDEYRRQGSRFLLVDGVQHMDVPPGFLVSQLAHPEHPWQLALVGQQQPKGRPADMPTSVPETKPAQLDLETLFLQPIPDGKQMKYHFADLTSEFSIARIGNKWYRLNEFLGLQSEAFSGEQMFGLAKDGRWILLSEAELKPEDMQPIDFEAHKLPLEAGRNPLEVIHEGDVWERRSPDGAVIGRLRIDDVGEGTVSFDVFIPSHKSDQVMSLKAFQTFVIANGYGCDYREDMKFGISTERFFLILPAAGEGQLFGNGTTRVMVRGVANGVQTVYELVDQTTGKKIGPFPQEQTETYLKQHQLEVIKDGAREVPEASSKQEVDLPKAEKPLQYLTSTGKRLQVELIEGGYQVSEVETGAILGVFDAVAFRAKRTAERWQRTEFVDAAELKDIASLDRAITALKENLALDRAEYVRLDMEQATALKSLLSVFRQLRGKTDINPEVAKSREAYLSALVALQDLEVRRLKLQHLSGRALHEAIAGVVREYDFTEAERLYDLRHGYGVAETNAPFKEKCIQLWKETRWSEEYFDQHAGFKTREYHDGWKFFVGASKIAGEAILRAGKQYNTFNKTKLGKATTIGVGVVGGGILAFSGGGAAVAVAGLALTGKRVLGGIGLGLAANEAMDAYARRRREKQSTNKGINFTLQEEHRQAEEGVEAILSGERQPEGSADDKDKAETSREHVSEATYARLQAWLKQETIDKVGAKQAKLDRGLLYRRSAAIFTGFVFGSGIARDLIVGGGREVVSGLRHIAPGGAAEAATPAAGTSVHSTKISLQGAQVDVASESVVSDPTSSAWQYPAGELPNATNQHLFQGRPEPTPFSQGGGVPSPLPEAGEGLLGERTIKSGETLWKYAVESGKIAGLDEKSQARFAMLLREKVNEKLIGADTANVKAAGFVVNKEGRLSADFLQSGRTLQLGKLLNQHDITLLLEQAKQPIHESLQPGKGSIGFQDVAKVSDQVRINHLGKIANTALETGAVAMHEAGLDARESVAVEALKPTVNLDSVGSRVAELGKTLSVVDYIKSLSEEEQGEIFRTMRRTVRDLFDTPETNIFGNSAAQYLFIDHPEFSRVSAARVLTDHMTLKNSSLVFYDRSTNPLHWTQMQEVAKFSEAATKTLGKEVALPAKNESIEAYVLRVIATARGLGKTLSGYRMLH